MITQRFGLEYGFQAYLRCLKPNFGYNGFGEFVFYRTYSRMKSNGSQESWSDVVIRVIEGIMSIRKSHYLRNYIPWDEYYWQKTAQSMAISLFDMKWMPPGRGLWAMGTPYIYERGSMSLYNCAYVTLNLKTLDTELEWLMDALMCGVGVGFGARSELIPYRRNRNPETTYVIPDSKEGWTQSVKQLIGSYIHPHSTNPVFDYSKIRARGLPIKGFGGIASGPEILRKLHEQIRLVLNAFVDNKITSTRLKVDLANLIGCCVVSGNVRRSAEIAIGDINDLTFLDLKDYNKFPERANYGWMSNNSVILKENEDFEKLSLIADRVVRNGEPGYINLVNFEKGRLNGENYIIDKAVGINPCGEIPLEDYETCNVVETCPLRCSSVDDWYNACKFATIYASTVTLLPTHRPETNNVVTRNRRIGISIMGVADWKTMLSPPKIRRAMRNGYKIVRETNRQLAAESGIPASIRVTTIKPGGTVPKLAGVTGGIGYPTSKYTLRRVRVADSGPITEFLIKNGVPHEPAKYSDNTLIFEFPIIQNHAPPAKNISLWHQAANLVEVQSDWSDNAVSNTLYFKENEDVLPVLTFLAPLTKSVSMLPVDTNTYEQMPEQELTEEQFSRLKQINIDWSKFSGSDGQDDRYCSGDRCDIVR